MLDLRAIPSIPVYHLFLKRILFHFPIDNCQCILFSFLPSHLFLVFYLHASPEPAHLWDMGGNRSSGGKSKDCELRFESLGTIAQNSFPKTITQALVWADIIILFCLITLASGLAGICKDLPIVQLLNPGRRLLVCEFCVMRLIPVPLYISLLIADHPLRIAEVNNS